MKQYRPALRHCDDEARGRSNPELEVQSWMASCLAMTKCMPCDDETAPKSPKGDLQSVPT